MLDEIEKAHPDVFNILLQILDEGRLTDSHGVTVDFKNTYIFMTSNIGLSQIQNNSNIGFYEEEFTTKNSDIKSEALKALKKLFNSEFLNRIDDIIVFNRLTTDNMFDIVDILLDELNQNLVNLDICLICSTKLKKFIVENGMDLDYGARPLKRFIQSTIEDELSDQLLLRNISEGDTLFVDLNDDTVVFKVMEENIEQSPLLVR